MATCQIWVRRLFGDVAVHVKEFKKFTRIVSSNLPLLESGKTELFGPLFATLMKVIVNSLWPDLFQPLISTKTRWSRKFHYNRSVAMGCEYRCIVLQCT